MSFVDPRSLGAMRTALSTTTKTYGTSGRRTFGSTAATSTDDFVQNTLKGNVGKYVDATADYAIQNQMYNNGRMLKSQLLDRDNDIKSAYKNARLRGFATIQQAHDMDRVSGWFGAASGLLQATLLLAAVCCAAVVSLLAGSIGKVTTIIICCVAALAWIAYALIDVSDVLRRSSWRWDRYDWSKSDAKTCKKNKSNA